MFPAHFIRLGARKWQITKQRRLIIALVVILAAGGAGGWFFMGKKSGGGEESVEAASAPLKTSFVNLEPFTFNLLDEDQDRYAQIEVVLEVVDPSVESDLKAVQPAVRDALLMLMTSQTRKQLLSVYGKEDLSIGIVAAANAILAGQPAPKIRMPKARSKRTLKFKKSRTAYGEESDDRLMRDSDPDANEDEYREERRKRRSRRREPVIPERVYDAHFARFLVQ